MDEKDEKGLISKVKEYSCYWRHNLWRDRHEKQEKKIIVAYKVKHLQRFHMKKIEKDSWPKIWKKSFLRMIFIVSSDYKIFGIR